MGPGFESLKVQRIGYEDVRNCMSADPMPENLRFSKERFEQDVRSACSMPEKVRARREVSLLDAGGHSVL